MNVGVKRYSFLEWFLCIIMMAILLVTSLNVILRYAFKTPIFWSDEFGATLLVWIAFVGSGLAAAYDEHTTIDSIASKLSKKWKVIFQIGIRLISAAMLMVLVVQGTMVTMIVSDQMSPSLPISRLWAFIPVPIGCAIMFYYQLKYALKTFRNKLQ